MAGGSQKQPVLSKVRRRSCVLSSHWSLSSHPAGTGDRQGIWIYVMGTWGSFPGYLGQYSEPMVLYSSKPQAAAVLVLYLGCLGCSPGSWGSCSGQSTERLRVGDQQTLNHLMIVSAPAPRAVLGTKQSSMSLFVPSTSCWAMWGELQRAGLETAKEQRYNQHRVCNQTSIKMKAKVGFFSILPLTNRQICQVYQLALVQLWENSDLYMLGHTECHLICDDSKGHHGILDLFQSVSIWILLYKLQ